MQISKNSITQLYFKELTQRSQRSHGETQRKNSVTLCVSSVELSVSF